jgi:DNA polymerase-3 subunit gamma/tau
MAQALPRSAPAPATGGATALARAPAAEAEVSLAAFGSFEAVLDLIRQRRDMRLLMEVETGLRLVRYAPGRIEFEPAPGAPRDLAATLSQRLQSWTGARWGVSVLSGGGQPTVAVAREAKARAAEAEARRNPVVAAVFAAFPEARISAVRTPDAPAPAAEEGGTPPEAEPGEDWDPFEEG